MGMERQDELDRKIKSIEEAERLKRERRNEERLSLERDSEKAVRSDSRARKNSYDKDVKNGEASPVTRRSKALRNTVNQTTARPPAKLIKMIPTIPTLTRTASERWKPNPPIGQRRTSRRREKSLRKTKCSKRRKRQRMRC